MKTVFIVGAGASVPYGLPTGMELRDLIKQDLPLDFHVVDGGTPEERKYNQSIIQKNFDDFQIAFEKAYSTIDQFISERRKFEQISTRLIAAYLLPLELEALQKKVLADNWLGWICQKWHNNKNLFLRNVEFITFNYDRIIEYGLYSHVCNSMEGMTFEVLHQRLPITVRHVHGKFALPIDARFITGRAHAYLSKYSSVDCKKAAEGLCLLRRNNDNYDDNQKPLLPEMVEGADCIVFLGFGFDEANLRLLGFNGINNHTPKNSNSSRLIYASAYGMTQIEKQAARKQIGQDVTFGDSTQDCLAVLREYVDWL